MPPGKGFYGKPVKTSREGGRRMAPLYLLAAVPVPCRLRLDRLRHP